MQWVKGVFFFSKFRHAVKKQEFRKYSQNHQIWKIGKCSVWDVGDLVEGKGHCLQGGKGTQGINRYLCQSIVIQPQVAQGGESIKTASWYSWDVVCI